MTPEDVTRREFMSAATAAAVVPGCSSREEGGVSTEAHVNARAAQHSFEMFRKTVRPTILWNPFVLRITRELQRFGGG
jgi:hypothetical protein